VVLVVQSLLLLSEVGEVLTPDASRVLIAESSVDEKKTSRLESPAGFSKDDYGESATADPVSRALFTFSASGRRSLRFREISR
jgi:hypothetical protein